MELYKKTKEIFTTYLFDVEKLAKCYRISNNHQAMKLLITSCFKFLVRILFQAIFSSFVLYSKKNLISF